MYSISFNRVCFIATLEAVELKMLNAFVFGDRFVCIRSKSVPFRTFQFYFAMQEYHSKLLLHRIEIGRSVDDNRLISS